MGFAKDTTITFTAKIFSLALAVAVSIVVARTLGPEGKGQFALAALVPGLLVTAGQMGLGSAAVYYIGRRQFGFAGFFSNIMYSAVITGVVMVVLFDYIITSTDIQAQYLSGTTRELLIITAAAIPFMLVVRYSANLFLAEKHVVLFNAVNLFQQSVYLIMVLVILLWSGRGVVALAVCWLMSELLTALVSFVVLRRHAGGVFERPKLSLLKKAYGFGIRSHLLLVCLFLIFRLDQFLVSYFRGAAELGIYAVAVSLGELIWYVPRSLGSILFMRTAHDTDEAANAFTPVVCRHNLFIMLLLGLGAAIIGPHVIPFFYGDAFLGSVLPFLLLLPGIVAFGLFQSIASDLTGRGKPHWVALLAVAVLAANVAANLILTPRWGAVGAACASSASYTLGGVAILALFIKVSKTCVSENLILKGDDLREIAERLRRRIRSMRP
jgi:O-antigen/teichoic acid export membrane protein